MRKKYINSTVAFIYLTMNFDNPQNINMLWDILIDSHGDFIMKNNGHYASAIKTQFSSITKNFYDYEKKSGLSLIELNKKIISVLANEWVPMLKKQEQDLRKPPVKSEPVLFTAEDIQKSRKTEFEKQFSEKQNEFKSAMAQTLPPIIDFNEKRDEPIGEMEKLIAQTIAQRNFDINQFQNTNKEEAEKWLQIEPTNKKVSKNIKIGDPILPLSEVVEHKKQISWAPQLEEDDKNINLTESIFSKLKPMTEDKSDIKILHEKMDSLINKIDTLIDLFTKNDANKI